MTVEELIKELEKIEDKSKKVIIGVGHECSSDFEVIVENNSVNLFD